MFKSGTATYTTWDRHDRARQIHAAHVTVERTA